MEVSSPIELINDKGECFQLFLDRAHALVSEGRFFALPIRRLCKIGTRKIDCVELNLPGPKNMHSLQNETLV